MSGSKRGDGGNRVSPKKPDVERTERSSPGSGEDEQAEAADLQPDDVGDDDTAR